MVATALDPALVAGPHCCRKCKVLPLKGTVFSAPSWPSGHKITYNSKKCNIRGNSFCLDYFIKNEGSKRSYMHQRYQENQCTILVGCKLIWDNKTMVEMQNTIPLKYANASIIQEGNEETRDTPKQGEIPAGVGMGVDKEDCWKAVQVGYL